MRNCEAQTKSRNRHARVFIFVLSIVFPLLSQAQQQEQNNAESPPPKKIDISQAWDQLLRDVIPKAPADPVLTVPQNPFSRRRADDFLNHFFLDLATEYRRQEVSFTGLPTSAGIFEGTPGSVIGGKGIPALEPFQPNADEMYSFMNWGTRGWLSTRINTNFSFRYRQDLSHVQTGSPEQTILNTFPQNRRLELVSGYVEVRGQPGDSTFAGSSLQIGRQYTYGSELAAYDGVSYRLNRRRFEIGVFGGRRFTYYSDPQQRAIGGADFLLRLGNSAAVEYSTVVYVKGSHHVLLRNRINRNWFFTTYLKLIGGSAVEYSAQAAYSSSNGKQSFRFGFLQKLSSMDYVFDYTELARDRDAYNRLARLNLGVFSPYSQFVIEGRRELNARIRVGGSGWFRRLNDAADQGPFDASFSDYRISAQIFTPGRFDTLLEVHQRNTDRRSPLGATRFDDVSIAGETRVQDARFELRRVFGEQGRLTLKGGVFYRRFNFQDRFFYINNADMKGLTGGAQIKLDQHARLYFDYSLDDDFFIFRPSIKRAQVFVLGMHWKY